MVVENHPFHHHNQHHQFYRKNLHIHHQRSTTFLPMLCSRPSIKDVSLPQWRDRASSSCDDPLSPRIGCMGQVKKRNNKIAGFPTTVSSHRLSFTSKSSSTTTTTTSSSSNSSSPIVKYSKLKNLFYGKNFSTPTTSTTNTTSAAAAVTTISRCGTRNQRVSLINSADRVKKGRCSSKSDDLGCSISIDEMDPPLPVIKKVQKVEEGSLWKRRSGGPALKSLQLQQIHHPRICLQPTSV